MSASASSLRLLTPDSPPALRTTDAVDHFERAMSVGLDRLQGACDARRQVDGHLESVCCDLAWQVARLVVDAGLSNTPLPRGYMARSMCGEPYIVKYPAQAGGTEGVDGIADQACKPLFALARRNSIVGRHEPSARRPSHAQILEFTRDLELNLVEEIADYIEYCNRNDEQAAGSLARALGEPKIGERAAPAQPGGLGWAAFSPRKPSVRRR